MPVARGNPPLTVTARRAAPWALAILATVVVWVGPPVLHTIWMVGAGVYILGWGPRWQRLWLATILGVMLVAAGLILGLVLLIG